MVCSATGYNYLINTTLYEDYSCYLHRICHSDHQVSILSDYTINPRTCTLFTLYEVLAHHQML